MKVIKLKEQDLQRIVKRVLNENNDVGNDNNLFTLLENFYEENDVHHSCHTTLDDFVSYAMESQMKIPNIAKGNYRLSGEPGVEKGGEAKVNWMKRWNEKMRDERRRKGRENDEREN
tara:strand:+ start:330 stop:680 length:351 start_codon:yes stop_codon:yes gene_type:complete